MTDTLYQKRTKSLNHQFPMMDLEPIEKWCKTTVNMIGGTRLNPNHVAGVPLGEDEKPTEYYILRSLDDGLQTKWTFRYLDDVIELYSEREIKHFRRFNAEHIANGTLILWDDSITDGTPLPFSDGELD